MVKNKLIEQDAQDKIQKAKLKNFGDTDDFSIEIETNLEIFGNKNKNQSRNNRNNLFKIEESYKDEVSVKTATNSGNKTLNKNSSSGFKTFTNFNNDNNIKNSCSGKNLDIHKENLILKPQPEVRGYNNKDNNNYNYNNKIYLTSEIYSVKQKINNNKNNEYNITHGENFNTNNTPKNLIKINKEFNTNNIQSTNNNKISLKSNSKKNNNESSILDDTFNNSKLQENSELPYRPCKTVVNMDLENSRTNNLKRKMIDDLDSIIYNNIEKLFENNINTKQIKKNVDSGVNLNSLNGNFNNMQYQQNKKNLINKKEGEYNSSIMESGVLDETESYYHENENNVYYNSKNKNYINNKNVKSFNCSSNKFHKEKTNNLKNIYNRNDYSDTYEEPESSQLPNSLNNESDIYNDNDYNCNYKDNYSLKDFSRNDNNNNNNNFYSEELDNNNVIKNNNLFQNYKIQNSKYINTNLNKEKPKNDKRNLNENNAENTIKFGISTEFRDNINLGESFMSSNMGDIAKMELTIKHSYS